ncbi:TetR family transcriptional regulator [Arthrobacter sp. zg-Y20]|uniref:TetR/AcrR family transcriptional regulator n=1 Tax=unclassified Arthrobacter TaxID=235627 RepID=UPI001D14BEBD|nr:MULTISPECIES: TetR family transcriptional regulator [unclassified Arthrobacter]MCC3275356.1 TetR family transcriptional regulator [Arthrobacter sp. zg-Y20]MDK1315515.1 TetR family transcriptional regulator [Arthrobacter sp. zg.Y20]WIB05930.1 TetR family transcriptional regulator [Arthrobacter sp. zg-Y20]
MARDAEATRERILAAATVEFAAHGFAGGRVERIASQAQSNVRMIYAYYGSKSGLFDATLAEALRRMAANVPPRPEDLAGWAGDVFDHHQRFPEVLRLSMWAQLERPEATAEPSDIYRDKTLAVAAATARPLSPVDLLVFIYAIAQAWQLSPKGLTDLNERGDEVAARRQAVVTAVERMLQARGFENPHTRGTK